MAVNPMQRKSRNSFLLGMIITLLITGIIIVMLFLQLKKKEEALQAEIGAKRLVYVLNDDVKSGQILTQDLFELKKININEIPSNATSTIEMIDTWYLQTKDGQAVQRDKDGLYLEFEPGKADAIIEIFEVTPADTEKNAELQQGGYYRIENGEKVSITLRGNPYSDEAGLFVIDTNEEDTTTRIYQETTESLYYYKLDPATNNKSRVKQYLELNNVPVLAKIDMKKNTVMTPNLVVQSDAVITDDVRKQEYNMVVLPIDLLTDDYVDIRLMLPNGQDFIVVSKAQVTVPLNNDGTYVADTISMNLREDEILAMSSAIVEAYGVLGSKLYATRYAEPGMQASSLPNYTPNNAVTAEINADPNIVAKASKELASRYSQGSKDIRNQYLQDLINTEEDYKENITDQMQEKIENSLETRQRYLESLGY